MTEETQLQIVVDMDKSTLDDWELVAKVQTGDLNLADIPAWLSFLRRVLVGGTEQYPMHRLPAVIRAVASALGDASNPKDGQGKV